MYIFERANVDVVSSTVRIPEELMLTINEKLEYCVPELSSTLDI